jgi:hypothetical protein
MTQPVAGWYPDPSDPSRRRYFDGHAWTENYAPFFAPTPTYGQPAQAGMSTSLKVCLALGAAVVVLIGLGSIGNSDKTSSSSSRPSSSPLGNVFAPTTSRSGFTPAQDNAIAKAESYLSHSAFSEDGLIKQLEFEQFSTTDATFAVHQIEASGSVDWNEQAVNKAKSYLSHSSFSLPGLVKQLEFDGFTPVEAQYGANTAYGG